MTMLLAGSKQKGESRKAVLACNDYLRMGRGRSIADLWRKYTEVHNDTHPTRSYNTLRQWSSRYNWDERASEYDALLEQQKNERRQQVMESGFALDFERTDELKKLAHFLIGQIYEQGEDGVHHNVWLPDVKQIGSGKNAERVDIERFNAAILTELRGILDDLAKETGGRIRNIKASLLNLDVTELTDGQLKRIADGEDPLVVLATSGGGGAGTPEPDGPDGPDF